MNQPTLSESRVATRDERPDRSVSRRRCGRRLPPALSWLVVWTLGATSGRPTAQTVHYLTPTGWQEAASGDQTGKLAVHLEPDALGEGRTTIVVAKPAWMTLADEAPPQVTGVRVDNRTLQPHPGLMLGAFWTLPAEIRVAFSDDKNPLDPSSLRVQFDGQEEQLEWQFLPAAGPGPQKAGELRLRPRPLEPGTHELSVTVADRSPFARTLTERYRLAVNGQRVSENGQRLTLVAGGVEYVVRPDFRHFLTLGDTEQCAYPTVQFRTPFYSVRKFTNIQVVVDEPTHKVVRVEAVPAELSSDRLSRHVALQFDFELAGASKLLKVTTRLFNRSTSAGDMYCFWNAPPGAGYSVPGKDPETVESREWSRQYLDLGVLDWVFLNPMKPSLPGFGIASPQPLGESRFGGLLVYAEPKKARLPKDAAQELTFAIVPANSVEEVAEARRQFERATKPHKDGGAATTLPT